MVVREEQERVRTLLCDTITLLCRNGLSFKSEFNISAVIGITLDKEDVFLVDIRETIKNQCGDVSDSGESEKVTERSSRRHRKRRKRSYSTDKNADSDSEHDLSEPTEKEKKPRVEDRLEVKTEVINESDDEDLVFVKNEPAFFSPDLTGSYNLPQGVQDNMSQHSQTAHQYQDSGGQWNTPAPPTFEPATPSTSDTSLLQQQQPGQMNLDASIAQEYWEGPDEMLPSSRKKAPHLLLTNVQRDDIIDWFQQNPCLYDRSDENFKLPPKEKFKLWNEKAHDLDLPSVDGTRLKMWVDGVRTLYGKLTKSPPTEKLSHRNKWVLTKMDFLKDHIFRKALPRRGAPTRTRRRRDMPMVYGYDEESYLLAQSTMGDWENEQPEKLRKKVPAIHLTRDQQNDIAEWFQDHPCFYDRSHEHFHLSVEKKLKIWEEKAQELDVPGVDGPRLKKWVDSVRTDYGKLTRHPMEEQTSWRKKWIIEKWDFLGEHLFRKGTKTLLPVAGEDDDYNPAYGEQQESL